MTTTCIHYEIITTPCKGQHMMGLCLKCGRLRDYTELQSKIPFLRESNLNPNVSMEMIMLHRRGRPKKKKEKSRSLTSAGRVR